MWFSDAKANNDEFVAYRKKIETFGRALGPLSLFCPTNFDSAKVSPLLKGIESVNFNLQILPEDVYRKPLICSGKEAECTKQSDTRSPDIYEKHLKDVYFYYPKSLLPAQVTKIFVEEIANALAPSLSKTGCNKAAVNIISDAPRGHCIDVTNEQEAQHCMRKSLFDYANDPASITITVEVSIQNESLAPSVDKGTVDESKGDERIAVIEWKLFRPFCFQKYLTNVGSPVALSLKLSDEMMGEALEHSAESLGTMLRALQISAPHVDHFSCELRER